MTEKCVHGITGRNCYSCHCAATDTMNCPDSCWCKKYRKSLSVSEMHGALKPLIDRIEKVEGYMNIEDRITASDVLQRLAALEHYKEEIFKLLFKTIDVIKLL